MAQPGPRARARAEPEETRRLEQFAVEAAAAYRDYLIRGEPALRQRFWTIYNRAWSGATLHDNSVFMNRLYGELERVGQNPQVSPLLDAFVADRGRLFGFLWRNPAHFTDFIDTVFNIRTVLERGTATDEAVTRLARRYRELGSRPVRADTDLARVRTAVQGGMAVEDAARAELERSSREDAAQRYGEGLAQEVIARQPAQLARRAAVALRDFMLTGNEERRLEFRRIFDANNYQVFTDAFTREFTSRIYNDTDSGLAAVARAYNTHHGGTEPNEFATMVANLYTAASTGTIQQVETLRTNEGTDVIDPLLSIVARGMARRSISLLRDVLETGSSASRDRFVQILNGRLAVVVEGNVQMPTVENNDVFWNEFTTMYEREISRNSRLATLVRSFSMNILPIAIRDIYLELARGTPNRSRLVTDYGEDIVALVEGNFSGLSWMMRQESEVNTELARRARAEESAAVQLTRLRVAFPRGRALSETYSALIDERVRRRALEAPDVITLIEQNFDSLSYLAGTPAEVQAELDRRARARQPDTLAVQLRARFPQNAGQALSDAYRSIQALRQGRARLVTQYGQEFVGIVERNLDSLGWLVMPVQGIETQMRSRRDDAFIVSVNTTVGYSVGTLAHALRVIYTELGRSSPERARLEQRYGAELVQFVATHRQTLSWLGGDFAGIERALQDPTRDPLKRRLQARLYSYSPIQLVSAIVRARGAVSRGGIALQDARDAYGERFIPDIAARLAVTVPSLAPEAARGSQAQIASTARRVDGELDGLERQLSNRVLEPARGILREQIRLWRIENNRLRDEAASTTDPQVLARITADQTTLFNQTILQASDLRRSVEMAFAMIHLAETGGDLFRQAASDVTFTDANLGTLRTLLQWYQGLGAGKQETVGRVVAAVLQRADARLFQFIGNMDQPSIFQGLVGVYGLTQRRGGTNRQSLVTIYGEQFVSLVESLAPNLRVLESPAATMSDLQRGENALYAAIVIRCYRALANPREGENRESMVRLFGEEFVRAIEANRAQMEPLAASGAGLTEVRALPAGVKSALSTAYVSAYNRTITTLVRTFRHQDATMFSALVAVRAVMSERPSRTASAEARRTFESRVQELYSSYGQRFVRAVSDNMESLGFLESPSAAVGDLSRLQPALLETLHSSFESGPGAAAGTFMTNYVQLARAIPRVYTQLRASLLFSTPADRTASSFRDALALYRQEFGQDNYLFTQYINLDLFNRSLRRLAERYGVALPQSIDSPEALSRFLASDVGQQLITAGRESYETLEREYLQARTDANWHPTSGDFTDANVTALRSEITILDALYLGMARPLIAGMGSAFSRNAAQAMMNSLLVVAHRDPYLVGPYLLQVLPAIVSVAQDERTIVAAIEAFNQIFIQRFEAGAREMAYSSARTREYMLRVFASIGERLAERTSTYGHTNLEDELRLTPEPRTDEGYLSPLLYRQRPGFWQGEGLEPLPPMWGQFGAPISLIPRPQMTLTTSLPSPTGTSIDAGAMEFFTRMDQGLRPPISLMFRQRVPARFRIGVIGASTIIRSINQLFGPMPVDYNDYWLSMSEELGAFYQRQEGGGRTTDTGGAAGILTARTVTGGERATARYTGTTTDTDVPAAPGASTTSVRTSSHAVDVNAQAVRLPMPMSGPVPLPLFGLVPYNMFNMGEGTGIHRARQEFHYETTSIETRDQGPADASGRRPEPTTVSDIQTAGRTRGLLETYQRIARTNSTDMLLFVAGEHVPEMRGVPPTRADIAQRLGITEQQYNQLPEADLQRMATEHGFSLDEVRRGAVSTPASGNLRSRLYFVTREGNIYQVAYGAHTESQLMNYLYAGANTDQVLASARFLGREMLPGIPLTDGERRQRLATALSMSTEQIRTMSDAEIDRRLTAAGTSRDRLFGSAAGGFDGSAIGITLPTGGGDTFSALAFGELVRSLRTMDPVHAEQAVGMAVTNLLQDRRQRDIYAAFYRGAEITTADPQDRSRISDTRFSQGIGEVMWRRVRIDPMAYQAEVRAVGGWPLTAGARVRAEWRSSRHRTSAFGALGAYSNIDLLREFRAVDTDASEIYGRLNNILVSLYGWSEDTARDTGWLAAGSYLYSRMEDYTVRNPDGTYTTTTAGPEGTPEQHYASAMFMYWAQRHGILVGAQRVPGWSRIYDRIDRAMTEIARDPTRESSVLQTLSESLREELNRDIWRFALAYGYDGERVRVYIVSGGQWTNDETAYGNLRAMVLMGRPTWGWADILGHAYGYSPVVISEDATAVGGFTREPSVRTPFLDLYAGFGLVDWPSIELHRYSREATIRASPDLPGALRDVYRDMGGMRNRSRMVRIYGETLVNIAEEGRESLSWMIRPRGEVRTELQRRLGEDDAFALSLMTLRRGVESARSGVRDEDAAAIIDIYTELHRAVPDRDRLGRSYARELVEMVEGRSVDLDFLLLPPDRMRQEFTRRAARRGTIEARIASEAQLPEAPAQESITGPEFKRMVEQNMLEVLFGTRPDLESRVGLNAERYDVILGTHLNSPEGQRQRISTFYILHTPVGERADSRGSLVVGDETDLDEWMRHGHQIGRGITRVEVGREGTDYHLTFTGDRRARTLTAARVIGGVTLPLRPDDYSRYQVEHNWTVGGLVSLFQDHRLDILGGALYGTRQYGNERWDQWQVALSGRLQGTSTATFTEQWYGYIFFNQMTKRIVFASGDVFNNADEMRQVCTSLSGSACSSLTELSRTTGGAGVSWARTDVITGDRLSFHLFFEGGAESYTRPTTPSWDQTPSRSATPVWRAGLGFEYVQQSRSSAIPTIYSLTLGGQSGSWPLLPGDITRPEYFNQWGAGIENFWPGSFILGGNLRVQW